MADGLLGKIGKGFNRYIGGLLGEDLEKMTPEERSLARRQALAVFAQGMSSPEAGSRALSAIQAQRKGVREQAELKRRQQAAEQETGRITGRLFGGAPAAPEDMGEDETGLGPVAIQSQYRQNPQEALARMYGTSAGRDVAQMAPGLLKMAEERAAPEDYVYQSVSGVGLVAVNRKNPNDVKIVQPERARATGPSERFKILSPEEARANNLPAGVVYQQNTLTKQITPMSGAGGGLDETSIRQFRAADIGIQNARGQIKNLQSTLADVPAYKAIAGEGRGRLESSYSLALSAIRQLQNSGVLNVGELPFLAKALEDPTSFSAIATSPIQRKKLQGQIDTVLKLLDEQEKVLKTQYGMPMNAPSPTSEPSSIPRNPRRQPSAAAKSRAESYYGEGG